MREAWHKTLPSFSTSDCCSQNARLRLKQNSSISHGSSLCCSISGGVCGGGSGSSGGDSDSGNGIGSDVVVVVQQ